MGWRRKKDLRKKALEVLQLWASVKANHGQPGSNKRFWRSGSGLFSLSVSAVVVVVVFSRKADYCLKVFLANLVLVILFATWSILTPQQWFWSALMRFFALGLAFTTSYATTVINVEVRRGCPRQCCFVSCATALIVLIALLLALLMIWFCVTLASAVDLERQGVDVLAQQLESGVVTSESISAANLTMIRRWKYDKPTSVVIEILLQVTIGLFADRLIRLYIDHE